MSVDFGSTGQLSIGGTNYMTIDGGGRVLRPYQTSFCARDGNAASAGQDVIFGGVIFNLGSNYNAGNGRFTAPVAGKYFLRYHQLAPHPEVGEFRTAIYVNGGGWGGSRFIMVKTAGWFSLIADGHVSMNAGDYATIRYESGTSTLYTDGNYVQFSGHLIG